MIASYNNIILSKTTNKTCVTGMLLTCLHMFVRCFCSLLLELQEFRPGLFTLTLTFTLSSPVCTENSLSQNSGLPASLYASSLSLSLMSVHSMHALIPFLHDSVCFFETFVSKFVSERVE
jgi:hypothetical protein